MKNDFNVLIYDINFDKIVSFNIMSYLLKEYKEEEEKPINFESFKKFIIRKSMYRFWGRCEYEIIVNSFPKSKEEKIDVYFQIQQNLDLITRLLMENVNEDSCNK